MPYVRGRVHGLKTMAKPAHAVCVKYAQLLELGMLSRLPMEEEKEEMWPRLIRLVEEGVIDIRPDFLEHEYPAIDCKIGNPPLVRFH
jgi:hypothetical protein